MVRIHAIIFYLGSGIFVAISPSECPLNPNGLPTCAFSLSDNDLCRASWKPLPDGNKDYDVNNCGYRDVFKFIKGTIFVL